MATQRTIRLRVPPMFSCRVYENSIPIQTRLKVTDSPTRHLQSQTKILMCFYLGPSLR